MIVADDGSASDVGSVARSFAGAINLQYFWCDHSGPGAARNIAIRNAEAPFLILWEDDLRPLARLLEYCLEFHRLHAAEQDASLLYFAPDQAIADVPAVRWAFNRLYPFPQRAGLQNWGYFWSGALTCKKSLFRYGEFDPGYLSLEDADLGLRLSRQVDLRVHFEPRLTGTMTRRLTFTQICSRQYSAGYFSYLFARANPGAVVFDFPPYNRPEGYLVADHQQLAAIVAAAHGLERQATAANGQCFQMLCALWSKAEIHAKADGWITARDGRPPDPPGTIGAFLKE